MTVCEFCGADLAPSAGAADATPMAPPSPSETSPIFLTPPIPDKKEYGSAIIPRWCATELVFLGTGAACGVPAFYCGCKGCVEALAEPRYRRTRCGIAVLGNKNFLFDAPPELASQLLREHIREIDYFILTHAHPDHCAGLGDLEIYTRFYRRRVLPAVMSRETLMQLEGSFETVNDWRTLPLLRARRAIAYVRP